jgi:hypothetical protein
MPLTVFGYAIDAEAMQRLAVEKNLAEEESSCVDKFSRVFEYVERRTVRRRKLRSWVRKVEREDGLHVLAFCCRKDDEKTVKILTEILVPYSQPGTELKVSKEH